MDKNSYYVDPSNSIFSKKEILEFESETVKLNKEGKGDQAVFFLRKNKN